MRDYKRLFTESLRGISPLEEKLTPRFEYADLVTFAQNKATPVYNWFYYKEGFSRDLVWKALSELGIPKGSLVLDPFCGTGTTLLAAKQAGYRSAGFDVLPLGILVSKVKLEDCYDMEKLECEVRRINALRFGNPATKAVGIGFMDMKTAFSRYALMDIAYFREKIMEVEDEKIRNFLLLGLVSIVSQASNVMKDGGVLRVVKKRHLPPVRHLLRNKLKRMLGDLKDEVRQDAAEWTVRLGDARKLPLEDNTVDAVLTSPPYLNFVDYTKVYALELSLLVSSTKELNELRKKTLRSHVGAGYDESGSSNITDLLERDSGIISSTEGKTPPIVEGYLNDLYLSARESERVLKKGGCAAYVVANAALPGITVDVDIALAAMAEKTGLQVEDIWVANARWADVHGIVKERPVRESIVVLKKS
jgi:SAM-dependent methyltransferase